MPSMIPNPPAGSLSGRFITTSDGVTLFVQVKGQGLPCLYVHGGPGSGSYWMEKFSAGMLEQHFQMIYLDQRGVGRSSSPGDGNYSMGRMAQDFEEVRAALGIERWLTMGHSFGVILQMGYAQRFPEAMRGMILLNGPLNLTESFKSSWGPKACEFLGISDPQPYLDENIPVIERMGRLGGMLREKGLFWKMAYARQESEAIMNASFAEVPNWNGDQEEAILAYPEYASDYTKAAEQMHMPVLYFYGKTDWMGGTENYRCVHFPQLMLWGSDVGHVAILENKPDLEAALVAFQQTYHL